MGDPYKEVQEMNEKIGRLLAQYAINEYVNYAESLDDTVGENAEELRELAEKCFKTAAKYNLLRKLKI
ncbi:MAG: hypothetical protein QXQ77_00710 [Candidatus Aenigmatarchaeota archaeon]